SLMTRGFFMRNLILLVAGLLLNTLVHAANLLNYQCTDGTTIAITSTITPPAGSPPPVTPPPPPPAPGATAVVFQSGVFKWGGDYSWGVSVNYKDTSGAPKPGPYDIAVTGIGGYQPYANNF